MGIKDALLYISPSHSDRNERTTTFAATLAQQFGAEVSGLTFVFDLPYRDAIFTAVAENTAIRDLGRRNREQAAAALADTESAFKKAGVRFTGTLESSLASDSIDLFIECARLRDIAVLPNGANRHDIERYLIEGTLFGSGRPLVLVPKDGKASFATSKIMVAWDYSRQAARAVSDAMPFLIRATAVHVVTVTDDKELRPRLDAVELAHHLARHDIKVVVEPTKRGPRTISEALFDHAAKNDIDLLVMGGFGHSRVREFILGGATEGALSSAPLPILMSH